MEIYNASKYNDILNRIHKKFLLDEGFYLTLKLYLTNNIFYYIICILFRLIPLIIIIIPGNYTPKSRSNSPIIIQKTKSLDDLINMFTCHNLVEQFNFSMNTYVSICILIYILLVFRLANYSYFIVRIRNKKYTHKWPLPSKYQIIMDHVVFLFFPFILEYLSLSYYIYFFPNQLIIINTNKSIIIIIIMIINTLLIILYNINNYLYIICSNKRYTTSKIEAYSRIKNEKLFFNKKPIIYRLSKVKLYCFIILQNIVLFQPLVNYIPTSSKNYYRIIITLIMLVVFLFLVINQLSEYNYKNIINYMIID
jgi:hypothetical protein